MLGFSFLTMIVNRALRIAVLVMNKGVKVVNNNTTLMKRVKTVPNVQLKNVSIAILKMNVKNVKQDFILTKNKKNVFLVKTRV